MTERSGSKRQDSRTRWSRRSPSNSRSRSRNRSTDDKQQQRRRRDSRDRRRGRARSGSSSRSSSRSRSPYRKERGDSGSLEAVDTKLASSTSCTATSAPQALQPTPPVMTIATEDEIAWTAAQFIQQRAQQEVELYLQSSDYQHFLEHLKRRERERILLEVQQELHKEKEILLHSERQKLQAIVDKELSAERIKVENQIKLEQHQNAQYLQRLQQDQEQLQRVQQRILLDKEIEAQRQSISIVTNQSSEVNTIAGKVSFALSKKKGLF